MAFQANLLLYAGALLFTYVACVHGSDANHLSALKRQCSPWNSCRHMRPESKRDFRKRNCECDFLCTAFNDCCYDAKARTKYPYPFRNRLDTCLPYGMHNEAVYVVGSCPPNYNGSIFVKILCESGHVSGDPTMATPFSDLHSASTYRNRYCAMCHGALLWTPWKVFIKFDDANAELIDAEFYHQNDFVFNQTLKKWGVYQDDAFRPFEIVLQKPFHVTDVRQCRTNLISSCPSDWPYENIARNCSSYLGVVHGVHHAYRNVDCAICNGVQLSELVCF